MSGDSRKLNQCVKCSSQTNNILVCETCIFNNQVNEATKIFNCHNCEKDFNISEACEHAGDIMNRNKGRFQWDDLVMCKACCNNPESFKFGRA